jgi:hypothetical protein
MIKMVLAVMIANALSLLIWAVLGMVWKRIR